MSFLAVPGTRIGDYVIVSEIGRGGMAIVYLAEHPNLGRKVALKLLSAELADDESFRARFMREARLAAGIEHPNIVPVHDAGEAEGLLYIAMRYVEGVDLAKLLEREGKLPLDRSTRILAQVAAALDAAHAKGLVHRDVKPSNVLLAPGEGPGGEDHAYLADFGLARPQLGVSSHTQVGDLYGTVDYMAPEQLVGRPTDARTDVYALSCLAYECLVGEPPFRRDTVIATASAHLHDEPTPPSERNPELPMQLDPVLLKGLAKDKASRQASAGRLIAELRERSGSAVDQPSIATSTKTAAYAREERKVVSVLFCDLVEFTAASDAADPEDVRARIKPYHDLLRSEIERFGGTVEKFIGDAVMAVFGAPLAHEDDAERAVRAGLRIVEAIEELNEKHPDFALKVRVGIETGEAVVVLGARPELGEGIVTGDIVNTASRLQGVAPEGGVGVGEGTYIGTKEVFEYDTLEPVTLKGKAARVRLFHAKTARSRFGTDLTRVRAGDLVGRALETSMLIGAFERAVRDRSVQLVTIVGEPGVGKTRQVAELNAELDERPDLVVRWRQGRCLPYGDGITFWALGEIVKAEAGILESDEPESAKAKLDRALPVEDPDREWMFQRLLPLLGIDAASTAEREEAFTAWRRFLEHLTSDGPAVLVFEDLHWADDALLAFLEHVVEYTEDVPLLLLATARPELFERHPAWAGTARNANRINLAPLSETEIATLVGKLLGQGLLPVEVQQLILDRAGGNPLYAEEFIRLLKDRQILEREGATWRFDEAAEVPLPAGIQGLIAARLDTLAPERKAMLQDAAVLGKVFWSGALAEMTGTERAVIEESMHELSRKELVRKARTSSMQDEREYAFWHGLVRDVCYGQIPRASRAAKHLGAAAWIERIAARVEDHAEILASHYTEALDLLRATRDDVEVQAVTEPAVRYLLLAGERSLGLDVTRARSYLSRALELAGPADTLRPEVLMAWGEAQQQAGHPADAGAAFEEALAGLRTRGDVRATAVGLMALSNARWQMADKDAFEMSAEALSLLEAEPAGPELVAAYSELAAERMMAADYEEAIRWADRAMGLARQLGLGEPHRALSFRGVARACLGIAGGLDDQRRALQLAIERGRGRDAAVIYGNLAADLVSFDGPATALETCLAGIEFSDRRGIREMADSMAVKSLDCMVDQGRWDEALDAALELEKKLDVSDAFSLGSVRAVIAKIFLLRGAAQRALPLAEENLSLAAAHAEEAPAVLADAAAIRVAIGDEKSGLELLERLEQTPNGRLMPPYAWYLPQAVRTAILAGDPELAARLANGIEHPTPYMEHALVASGAVLAEAAGNHDDAATRYGDAADRWRAFGVVPELAFALLGQGRSLIALGRQTEAIDALTQAREIFASLGATPSLGECDRHLSPS
jgi:class 3 adenylate cyclase/tetratricopeptide (TPR) repeat protein